MALGFEQIHHLKQTVYLLWRQHSRRLIQNQNVHVAIERFDNFHTLAHAHRQILDDGVRIYG